MEIDVTVYNMTKNPKTYKKIFLVTVLKINMKMKICNENGNEYGN